MSEMTGRPVILTVPTKSKKSVMCNNNNRIVSYSSIVGSYLSHITLFLLLVGNVKMTGRPVISDISYQVS